MGYDEVAIAGGMRGRAVELAKCVSVNEYAVANAEVVIEGEYLPNVRVREDENTKTGFAMPEFSGYNGEAKAALPVIKVSAVTHRKNPILQTIVGPGDEHGNLQGIPVEASILKMVNDWMPGKLPNCYSHPVGGGKWLVIMQFKKTSPADEGRQRQAAVMALAAYPELKQVIIVDDDVDIFDSADVLWALTGRYQGNVDTIFIPGVACHMLDPSNSPEFNYTLRQQGTACKTIFDCTVPFSMKDKFVRAKFKRISAEDLKRFTTPSAKPLVL
jgi:4-hydroxy-3-polyprenylbenzoate decarboxylase